MIKTYRENKILIFQPVSGNISYTNQGIAFQQPVYRVVVSQRRYISVIGYKKLYTTCRNRQTTTWYSHVHRVCPNFQCRILMVNSKKPDWSILKPYGVAGIHVVIMRVPPAKIRLRILSACEQNPWGKKYGQYEFQLVRFDVIVLNDSFHSITQSYHYLSESVTGFQIWTRMRLCSISVIILLKTTRDFGIIL